jgi:hypothetical protein
VSLRGLLVHRADILRLEVANVAGAPDVSWKTVAKDVRLRMDLNFLRPGKDSGWVPEAGRSPDRSGVAFFLTSADVRSGDRIKMTKGPTGTFLVDGAVDDPTDRTGEPHHIECGVTEVAKALGDD